MGAMMRILVACEESQRVCVAFRQRGHEAFSCDLEPCSGGHPEWHIQDDVVPLLRDAWDMIIAFPPCTHLCVSGARWFTAKRADGRQRRGVDFFMGFANCSCPRVCIENPIGIMSTQYRKPDQIIQPWMFGHPESKATCLWLRGLPLLVPSRLVEGREPRCWKLPPSTNRAQLRSKTYPGIAEAMAQQWSNL